jgi:hypothetical protein
VIESVVICHRLNVQVALPPTNLITATFTYILGEREFQIRAEWGQLGHWPGRTFSAIIRYAQATHRYSKLVGNSKDMSEVPTWLSCRVFEVRPNKSQNGSRSAHLARAPQRSLVLEGRSLFGPLLLAHLLTFLIILSESVAQGCPSPTHARNSTRVLSIRI